MKAKDNCIEENSKHFMDIFIYRISTQVAIHRPNTLNIQQHFRPIISIHIRSFSYKCTLIREAEWYQGHDYNTHQDLRRIYEFARKKNIW